MGINSILEPSILFISESEWRDIEKRDAFLEHFLGHLEKINRYSITKIYWTDVLEELLISHSYSPPWISDQNWSNQFFPILYHQFNPVKLIINDEDCLEACESSPTLPYSHDNSEVIKWFLELVHSLIDRNEQVYFCLGFEQQTEDISYSFYCNCHENQLIPIIIANSEQWFNHVDITSVCWPQNFQDAFKLKLAIEITVKTNLFKTKDEICYQYEFSESFIKNISKESTHRKNILSSLAKRLTLNQSEAASDEGLKDESVRGKGKKEERRFRVSGVCRIHYKYPQKGHLLLLNYYREGEHDKGLK